jgi:hypothetical protein
LSHRKNTPITSDNLDSKLLYFTIIAVVITNFIVRIKMFENIRGFDMSMIPSIPNFFTYYKLVWVLLVSIILVLALIYKLYKYKQKLDVNFVLLGIALVITASVISFYLDPFKEVTAWGLFSRNNGLLAYISLFSLIYIISHFNVQSKHISFMVHTINIASLVFVIIAIFQFFGLDMTNSIWYKQIYITNEYKHLIESINVSQTLFKGTSYYWASSIFGQVNYFGAYCSIIYPLITVFALREEGVVKKSLLIIGSIMLFIGTILAQSMGSIFTMFAVLILILISCVNKYNYKRFLLMCVCYTIISAVINRATNWSAFSEIYKFLIQILNSKLLVIAILMLIIYIILFMFRKRITKHRYRLISIVMLVVILIGTIGFVYILNNVVESNMYMLSRRGYVWHYSNELIKNNFIFGYGPDNLYYNFPQLNEHKSTYMPVDLIDKPHNMYLQVILDTGIFGLIGFMILLVGMLLKSNKAIDLESDMYKHTYFKALILLILAYMLQGIVNDNTIAVQSVVYMAMGIGASLIKQTSDKVKLAKVKELNKSLT